MFVLCQILRLSGLTVRVTMIDVKNQSSVKVCQNNPLISRFHTSKPALFYGVIFKYKIYVTSHLDYKTSDITF